MAKEPAAKKAAAPKKAAEPKAAKTAGPKAAKTAAPKAAKADAAPRKNDALQKPLTPSPELAAIVGPGMHPRGQVVSKVWDYIRKHDLQKPTDKRVIVADAALEKVFGVKECTMFEMNKHLARHLK